MRYFSKNTKVYLNKTDMDRLINQGYIEKQNLIIDVQDPTKQRTDKRTGQIDTRPFVLSNGDMVITRDELKALLEDNLLQEKGLSIKIVEPKPKVEPEPEYETPSTKETTLSARKDKKGKMILTNDNQVG